MFSPFQKKKNGHERQQGEVLEAIQDAGETSEEWTSRAHGAGEAEDFAGPVFANKAHMDKKSLDLVFAVEQMIQAKQHIERSHQDLQDRFGHANGQIDRLNRDLRNLNKVIDEREKSILDLEQRLTDKNLKVDQMMEDYRELQVTMTGRLEELQSAIEIERQNYASLLQKHNETLTEKNKRITELEEKNAKLENELSHIRQKFETLRQEKTHLVNIVNDFTSRMSSPFVPSGSRLDDAPSE